MKALWRATGLVLIILLGACASPDYWEVGRMKMTGPAFQKFLHQGYVGLARDEDEEGDYRDAGHFAAKGLAVAEGQAVGPVAMSARKIPAANVTELTDARARLIAALNRGAATKAPMEAADAQVMFDCWMQEQEENFQPRDIARCRDGFYAAIAAVEEALKPKPVMAEPAPEPEPEPEPAPMVVEPQPLPGPFLVFFDWDRATISADAQAILNDAAVAARMIGAGRIAVTAHADRSGSDDYNMGLSRRRAEAVKSALQRLGVGGLQVEVFARGEADPLVRTADGVREPQNRRASITFN